MSQEDGWAALNLRMPPRVPRTEYSAEGHWPLISAVTGIQVAPDAPEPLKRRAQQAFHRAWNYDLHWNTLIGRQEFGAQCSRMGHGIYAADGSDFDRQVSTFLTDPAEALAFDPWEAFGRRDEGELTRRFEADYAARCEGDPDAVNMTGIYITCISGLIDILGWEMLLLAAGTDLRAFGDLAGRYASWVGQYFQALARARVPVVMCHDDIVWTEGPFLPPEWYRRYVFPNYRKLFAPLVEAGQKVLFTSDGNYTAFIDDIAATGVSGFVMEPTTDMACVAEKFGRSHAFIGNADTRVLLSGTKRQIRSEVERCMAIGKGCPGFFLAVGNHIPPNTPVASAIYYNQVYEQLSRR